MKRGFARPTPEKPPVIKPENIVLPTPLSIPPPEGKPWWLVVVGVLVVGLLIGMVGMTFASGSHVFGGAGAIFPIFMIGGVAMMMFGGRFGGQQQMSRPKLDSMRAQFMLMLDMLRETAHESADSMDANYRWFHPAPTTLAAAVGSSRMWERKPDGKDLNFGVVRVGVGMTRPEVTWGEPQNMPTDIELEPVTGKALQEFGRYQSVVYNLPKMISVLVEPWYSLAGDREQVLGLMRAIVCQLAFSHGPDHVRMIVVSSDVDEWDWVKWLPHFGDPRRQDAAGNARMVYSSVREFAAEQAELFAGRGSFTPRHASSAAQTPTPHTVIIADAVDPQWEYVISGEGVDGVTFFDLTGSPMWSAVPERTLRFDKMGVIEALPRDRDTWMVIDEKPWFFALTDHISVAEAEEFAQKLARWRLAEAYEEIGQRVAHIGARDIMSYYGIDDPGHIDFEALWGSRNDSMGRSRLRAPFGVRSDNGELLFLDMKSLDEGGDGPHGVMSGTTGSGKSTLVRTVIESLMLSHPPEELQFVLADLKGGSAVKPFAGVPHVSRIITDLEEDQALMERFLDALWGEIARRKAICDSAGVDDAKEYNSVRSRMRARGQDMAPLPMLVVVIDEFYEWFRIMPTAVDVLDSIGRQGRAYWIHLMMASQTIESRAEKLMENMGYRLVLKARTAGAAQAAGVPNAVNLPAQAGLGYFRRSLEDIVRFQAEFLWRDYFPRGLTDDGDEAPALVHSIDYVRPQLFTNSFTPLEVSVGGARGQHPGHPHRRRPAGDRGTGRRRRRDPDAEGRYGHHRSAAQDRLPALPAVAAAAEPARRHRRAGEPVPRPPVAAGLRHRAGSGLPDRDHRPPVQARPAAVDRRHVRSRCQRPDPGGRRLGQNDRAADPDLRGGADPHARADPVLLLGLQQHRPDHGRRAAPRRRGGRSDRPVRRAPHGGRAAGLGAGAQAHLPRVRDRLDGGVPPAQVRRRARAGPQ